jgi:hypothetical protein
MSAPIDVRAGALLRSLIARRGTTAAAVGTAVGAPPGEVERMAAGGDRLDLARLERVLAYLGESPAEFFARLYAAPEAPAGAPGAATDPSAPPRPSADDPIPRQEVEALLAELRSMIDGMVRVLDAERILKKDE